MPPRRCVVQDCDQTADLELGISMHGSPPRGSENLVYHFMTVSGVYSKRCFEADFGIWRLILLFVRFFLVQTFMGSAIAACTLFGPIMFHVQPDLIEAPIRIPFL